MNDLSVREALDAGESARDYARRANDLIREGWALHRLRWSIRGTRLPVTEQLKALPAQMLLDVVHASALVAGSARSRNLLL